MGAFESAERGNEEPAGSQVAAEAPQSVRILSIDVDDLIIANADFFGEAVPASHQARVEADVLDALELLDANDAKATFFVNAQYKEQLAVAMHEIVARGHVLGSHGYRHRNIATLTLKEFESDLCRSLELIGKAQSQTIGYRPPAFSMPYDEAHLQILTANGLRYVSSGVGVPRSDAPRTNEPVEVSTNLLHVPISTGYYFRGRVRYPIGYGVASRLMPTDLYLLTLRRWCRRNRYFHYYCHSFEIAGMRRRSSCFRRPGAAVSTWIYMLRCWNRRSLFDAILQSGRFRSIEECLFFGNHGV